MLLEVQQYHSPIHKSADLPDVILIHGTGGDSTLWDPQIELLVPMGYRCIVPELRGHGQTTEPGEYCDLDTQIADIVETLESQNVRFPAIFVGHSLGAMISCVLAERRREMFKQILSISMPGRVPKPTSKLFSWFLGWPYETIKDSFLHHKLPPRHRILLSTELHSLREIVTNLAEVDFVERGLDINCPVHFSVGQFDIVAPAAHVKKMHLLLPGSTLHIFKWAGHSCMDDQPEDFNRWFLEKIIS